MLRLEKHTPQLAPPPPTPRRQRPRDGLLLPLPPFESIASCIHNRFFPLSFHPISLFFESLSQTSPFALPFFSNFLSSYSFVYLHDFDSSSKSQSPLHLIPAINSGYIYILLPQLIFFVFFFYDRFLSFFLLSFVRNVELPYVLSLFIILFSFFSFFFHVFLPLILFSSIFQLLTFFFSLSLSQSFPVSSSSFSFSCLFLFQFRSFSRIVVFFFFFLLLLFIGTFFTVIKLHIFHSFVLVSLFNLARSQLPFSISLSVISSVASLAFPAVIFYSG